MMAEEEEIKLNKFQCELCGVNPNSKSSYDMHMAGKKHLKNVFQKTKGESLSTDPTVHDEKMSKDNTQEIPNCFGRSSIKMSIPKARLLPEGCCPIGQEYRIDLDRLRQEPEKKEGYEDLEMGNEDINDKTCVESNVTRVIHDTGDKVVESTNVPRIIHDASDMDMERLCRGFWTEKITMKKQNDKSKKLPQKQNLNLNEAHEKNVGKRANTNEGDSTDIPQKKRRKSESDNSDSDSSSRGSSYYSDSSSYDLEDDFQAAGLGSLQHGPLSSLWSFREGVTPLITPEMTGSTKEVLDRCKIGPNPGHKQRSVRAWGCDGVSYDLFLSSTSYKRSRNQVADYHVVVSDYDAGEMSVGGGEVPLIYALVNGGNVSFFSLAEINLPQIISRG